MSPFPSNQAKGSWRGQLEKEKRSWTDLLPILDETMVETCAAEATEREREEFEEWFGIRRHLPATAAAAAGAAEAAPAEPGVAERPPHIVSATLFWKHVYGEDPDLPPPTREMLVDARRMGLVKRFAPWGSYIEPLALHTRAARERHPRVRFRLHLAEDLAFLADELRDLGWEIALMNRSSIRYCPGGFWRFLALEEDALVPGPGSRPIRHSKWPDYGFDEWFQLAALYPRLVRGGTLSFIPSDARSLFLPADLEYAMWANPNSRSLYFRPPSRSSAKPPGSLRAPPGAR